MNRYLTLLLFIIYVHRSTAQTSVHISSNKDNRQGILRGKNGACFAITANHDLTDMDLNIVGKNGLQTKGEVVERYPIKDIAIIRLSENLPDCNEWNVPDKSKDLSEQFFEAVLSVRDKIGDLLYIHVDIISSDNEYLIVKPKSDSQKLLPGMSGGVLYSKDRDWLGLLIEVDPDDYTGIIYQSDDILRLVDAYFPLADNFTLESALQIVESAVSRKDGANLGQIKAIEYLLRKQYDFKSGDFRGINLNRADLTNGNFESGLFQFAEMNEVQANGIILNGAVLDFVETEKANFSNAKLLNTNSVMLNAQNASFYHADLSGSLFFGADFRNADFTGANLKGTVFSYCDLRGAKFNEAQMIQTGLIASILDSATFTHSKFQQVNLNGSVASIFNFSEEQRTKICRYVTNHPPESLHEGNVNLYFKIMEKTPSSRFDSGFTFDDLKIIHARSFSISSGALPLCDMTDIEETLSSRSSKGISPFRAYEKSLLDKAGRRNKIVTNVSEFEVKCHKFLTSNRKYRTAEYEFQNNSKIADVTKQIDPVGIPIANDDAVLLALLKQNVIHPDKINWEYYAIKYLETKPDHAAWPLAINYGVSKVDILHEWIPKYKEWTLKRAKSFENRFLFTYLNDKFNINPNGKEIRLTTQPMKKNWRAGELFTLDEIASGKMEMWHEVRMGLRDRKLAANDLFLEHAHEIKFLDINLPEELSVEDRNNLIIGLEYQINDIGIRENVKDKPYLYAKVDLLSVQYWSRQVNNWVNIENYEQKITWREAEIATNELLNHESQIKKMIADLDNSVPILQDASSLIIELALKITKQEEINWPSAAMKYLETEYKTDTAYIAQLVPGWKPFYPPSSPDSRIKIPEKWVNLFRDWIIMQSQYSPKYLTLNKDASTLLRSETTPNTIVIKDFDGASNSYWKNRYLELFKEQNISSDHTDHLELNYVPVNRTKSYDYVKFIQVHPKAKNSLSFKFDNLPNNYPLRNLDVKVKYNITDIKYIWYKEQNVVLVYCEPSKILYKFPEGKWESTTDFASF